MTKLAMILPRWRVFFELLMTPLSISGIRPSLNISVWTPRSLKSRQVVQDRVRNRADAELQRGAVDDQVGDVPGDLLRQLVGLALHRLEDRPVARDQQVDVSDVDEAVARNARHVAR